MDRKPRIASSHEAIDSVLIFFRIQILVQRVRELLIQLGVRMREVAMEGDVTFDLALGDEIRKIENLDSVVAHFSDDILSAVSV